MQQASGLLSSICLLHIPSLFLHGGLGYLLDRSAYSAYISIADAPEYGFFIRIDVCVRHRSLLDVLVTQAECLNELFKFNE